MSFNHIFASQSGNVAASQLDDNFNAAGNMGYFKCTASGGNNIALTVEANQPAVGAYSDLLGVKFFAPGSPTGVVQIQIGSLPLVPLYDGAGLQCTTGSYRNAAVINASYNSGLGGFQLEGVAVTAAGFIIRMQKISVTGVYTPDAHLIQAIVEIVGGGGGGANGVNSVAGGGGGAAGGYARDVFDAATIGVSQAVTVGPGGAAATSGNITSLGTLLSANGGGAGNAGTSSNGGLGGIGGTATIGSFQIQGGDGGTGSSGQGGTSAFSGGEGGSSFFGGGGRGGTGGGGAGAAGKAYGSGGGGGGASVGSGAGGAGKSGYALITEYCSQ